MTRNWELRSPDYSPGEEAKKFTRKKGIRELCSAVAGKRGVAAKTLELVEA